MSIHIETNKYNLLVKELGYTILIMYIQITQLLTCFYPFMNTFAFMAKDLKPRTQTNE